MNEYQMLREECCETNRALPGTGLVDLTFGNVSVLDPDKGVFAIKPSGVSYEKLSPADMVLVDLEGKIVEGSLRPSSDTPTHRKLFIAFPGIRSVVHTHAKFAVTFAQAAKEIPLFGTTHADHFAGPVPVTREMTAEEIRSDYEWETGNVIVERFSELDPVMVPSVLVRNHGPFSWGTSGADALETAQALEIVAQLAWQTLLLDPAAIPPKSCLSEKHFSRKHGPGATYGQK